MRPLTLHVSALSNAEYDLYTTSLNDLAADANTKRDDSRYERTSVGVREVRAWLRGRYCNLPASDIDAILQLFTPNMLPSDTITGGQFFAALRLVIHAGSGKGIDRTLAFVQACPGPVKAVDVPRPLSPPKRPVRAPPSHPDRQKPPPLVTPSTETNPFTRRSIDHPPLPVPPSDTEYVLQQRTNKISHNPFLTCDNAADKVVPPAHVSNQGKLPPLPPRKPSLHVASSRRPSEAVPASMMPSGPPMIPTKPTHVMSPLMRQSLEASKHAQSLKRVEEQLDRERVLQVLKTSSSSSSNSNTTAGVRMRSLSPPKESQKFTNGLSHGSGSESRSSGSDDATYVPPLPRRRKPSLTSSTSSSALSLEQVASATLSPPTAPPFKPPVPNRDLLVSTHADHSGLPSVTGPGSIRPPTHPHRRPSTSTEPNVNDSQPSRPSSPRTARSKSVTSSSSAPPPPPRRKRPESMQLTPTSEGGDFATLFPVLTPHRQMHGRTASFQGVSRHLSLTRDTERGRSDSSPIANIQKTLTNFQLKAQPKLDAVRYKAEAGISKRGYVHHAQLGGNRWHEEGELGLMADTRWWSATDVDRDPYSEPTTDDEPSSGDDRGARKTTASDREFLTESDNLKWPMGEGWKPL